MLATRADILATFARLQMAGWRGNMRAGIKGAPRYRCPHCWDRRCVSTLLPWRARLFPPEHLSWYSYVYAECSRRKCGYAGIAWYFGGQTGAKPARERWTVSKEYPLVMRPLLSEPWCKVAPVLTLMSPWLHDINTARWQLFRETPPKPRQLVASPERSTSC